MLKRAAGVDPRMEGDAAGTCCSATRRGRHGETAVAPWLPIRLTASVLRLKFGALNASFPFTRLGLPQNYSSESGCFFSRVM